MSRVRRMCSTVLAVSLSIAVLSGPALGAKTKLLRDINPGRTGSTPAQLTPAGGMVFFTVGKYRDHLWRTKGHRYDTRRLDTWGGEFFSLRSVEGLLAYPENWRTVTWYVSDGTPQGTGQRADGITDRVGFLQPGLRAKLDGKSYFTGYRGQSNALMRSTDGNLSSGEVVRQFGGPGASAYLVGQVTRAGDHIFFYANDGSHGRELWVTDGTTGGTRMVRDIWPGSTSSKPNQLTAVGDRLFFTANTEHHGRELWTSDGTRRGTRRVRDIRVGTASSYPKELTRVGKRLFFVTDNGKNGKELWRSDGSWAGTRLVRDIRPGRRSSAPSQLTAVGGRVYFTATDKAHGKELWSSKGTARTTRLVRDIVRGPKGSKPRGLTRVGNRLVFTAYHPRYGRELWLHKR